MTFKIIENGSPFESQTFRSFLKAITGGEGGLISGLDLNQDDQVDSSIDVLKISPGILIFEGELIKISSTITMQNIYSKTIDGDVLFLKNPSGDPSFTAMQIGWGKLPENSETVVLAYRKNGLWHREINVIVNTIFSDKDWFHISHDNDKNITQIDLYPDQAFFDGLTTFDGNATFNGEI